MLQLTGGKEDGAVEVAGYLGHLELEGGDDLLEVHLRRQDGAIATAVGDAAEVGVVEPPRGEVHDGGLPLAAKRLGEVEAVRVELALPAEDAVGSVDDGGIGARPSWSG